MCFTTYGNAICIIQPKMAVINTMKNIDGLKGQMRQEEKESVKKVVIMGSLNENGIYKRTRVYFPLP